MENLKLTAYNLSLSAKKNYIRMTHVLGGLALIWTALFYSSTPSVLDTLFSLAALVFVFTQIRVISNLRFSFLGCLETEKTLITKSAVLSLEGADRLKGINEDLIAHSKSLIFSLDMKVTMFKVGFYALLAVFLFNAGNLLSCMLLVESCVPTGL